MRAQAQRQPPPDLVPLTLPTTPRLPTQNITTMRYFRSNAKLFTTRFIFVIDPQDDGVEEVIENPAEVLQECLEKFTTSDYIMEPGIFTQLKRYFQAGGNPEQVIEQLSMNYSAVAQMANLLAEWLILGGLKRLSVLYLFSSSRIEFLMYFQASK